jgi:hypothetical protein
LPAAPVEAVQTRKITVYHGVSSLQIGFGGDADEFKARIKSKFDIAGQFNLATGSGGDDREFLFAAGEECHVVEKAEILISPPHSLPDVGEWPPHRRIQGFILKRSLHPERQKPFHPLWDRQQKYTRLLQRLHPR